MVLLKISHIIHFYTFESSKVDSHFATAILKHFWLQLICVMPLNLVNAYFEHFKV